MPLSPIIASAVLILFTTAYAATPPREVKVGTSREGTLIGTWVGSYTCAQGLTGITLTISNATPTLVTAGFHFHEDHRNPGVPTGCFQMKGSYDASTKQLILLGEKWLLRPAGWVMVDFVGEVDAEGKTFTGRARGPGCTTFHLVRGTPPPGTPEPCLVEVNLQEQTITAGEIGRTLIEHSSVDLNILFEFNKAILRPEAKEQLDELGRTITRTSFASLAMGIYGHTDGVGSDSINTSLSKARAQAVLDYLVRVFKVDPSRFEVRGFGKTRLKRPDTPKSEENRRVEIVLLAK
jgi:outer membrane protein OmpA-like peptidoglycan-associated protein